MKQAKTIKLPAPVTVSAIGADVAAMGPGIPAIERIKLFSPSQWEEFVLEWAHSLKSQYRVVERCGGAGDMGRDVIGIAHSASDGWDNYQCKHYNHPIAPAEIWVELAKLVYYTFHRAYSYPHRCYFVAPRGVGTKLSNLFRDPVKLKAELVAHWDSHCRDAILQNSSVPLDPPLLQYLQSLDFSIFAGLPPLRIIDGHMSTRWHVARFGGGLPPRPAIPPPPATPTADEAAYLRAIFDAYGDHRQLAINGVADLAGDSELSEHLDDSRKEFYSAESLRLFSRDTLPPGEFESLQDEVHGGIRDEVRSDHPSGYRRLLAAVKTARSLQLTAHSLISRLTTRDRGGICHQLAGDGKVKWVK